MTSFPKGKIVAVLLAGIAALWMLLFTDVPLLKLVVAAPLLFLLPGYATVAAVFPQRVLGAAERLLFSVGISIGIVVVSGLLLQWLPFELQQGLWTVVLISFTLAASAVALMLRRDSLEKPANRVHQSFKNWRLPSGLSFKLHEILLMGLAAMVVAVAFSMAHTPAPQEGLEGYTMLWVSPGGVGTGAARLGVRNMEFTTVQYELQFEVEDHFLADGPVLTLEPGETWEREVLLPTEYPHSRPITISLYRLDAAAEPYRRLIWWPG